MKTYFKKGVPRFCAPKLSKFKMSYLSADLRYWKKFSSFQLPLNSFFKNDIKIWEIQSLKFTYEWRQQIWRHNLTFGVILWAILIGLMFRIFRPSLVGKEWKQAKLGVVWSHRVFLSGCILLGFVPFLYYGHIILLNKSNKIKSHPYKFKTNSKDTFLFPYKNALW